MTALFEKRIIIKESNILVRSDSEKAIGAARDALALHRAELENFIAREPFFQATLEPCKVPKDAPRIAHVMADAAAKCGVGPMAAVAGAFSDLLLEAMLESGAKTAIVENGGDIALKAAREVRVSVYAGNSPFSEKLGFLVTPRETPLGICTSSGTVGPSISFGDADAAVAIADTGALADAAATAIGNRVRGKNGVALALAFAKKLPVRGCLIVKGGKLAAHGKLPEIIRFGSGDGGKL